MKIKKPMREFRKKCSKCGNKEPLELYFETIFSGRFKLATDGYGRNDDVDWGGYERRLEDFIDNMLLETGKRKLLGCDKCLK